MNKEELKKYFADCLSEEELEDLDAPDTPTSPEFRARMTWKKGDVTFTPPPEEQN